MNALKFINNTFEVYNVGLKDPNVFSIYPWKDTLSGKKEAFCLKYEYLMFIMP